MNRFALYRCLLPVLAAGASSLQAQGPAPFSVPFQVPLVVNGARLKDSAFVGDAMAYRYEGRGITGLDEYVWPLEIAPADSAQPDSLLQVEVGKFKQTIPLGVERGWYDNFQIAFDALHPVALASDSLPGYVVALVFMRRREPFTSFFYIYAVQGMYLKIRLTVPGKNWNTNPALDLPAELVRAAAASNR
jgi:hypothetical protein